MEEREGQVRLVLVEWLDSYSSTGWQDVEELQSSPLCCRSVGWQIRSDEQVIVLAPHLTDEHEETPLQGNGLMTIPTCAVRRVQTLRVDGEAGEVLGSSYSTVSAASSRPSGHPSSCWGPGSGRKPRRT
jgi:hypothetical protein